MRVRTCLLGRFGFPMDFGSIVVVIVEMDEKGKEVRARAIFVKQDQSQMKRWLSLPFNFPSLDYALMSYSALSPLKHRRSSNSV